MGAKRGNENIKYDHKNLYKQKTKTHKYNKNL